MAKEEKIYASYITAKKGSIQKTKNSNKNDNSVKKWTRIIIDKLQKNTYDKILSIVKNQKKQANETWFSLHL